MAQEMSAFELYEHGLVLKQVKMFYQAIQDFQKAARVPQYAGKAHVQIALCLRAVGRHEDALLAFRHAAVAPSLLPEEHRHILYQMGRTLESLHRFAESLEVYGWIRKEDPGFLDVVQRIKHLSSGRRGPVPSFRGTWQGWMGAALTSRLAVKPQMMNFLQQTGQWLSQQAQSLQKYPVFGSHPSAAHGIGDQPSRLGSRIDGRIQSASRKRTVEHRRHTRVAVRLQSSFTGKDRAVTGKGELRDLSPWGCRVTSAVAVPVGTDLQCCIFPRGSGDAFIIEGATVRWINSKEFGLAFTSVTPAVQQQIVELCRAAA